MVGVKIMKKTLVAAGALSVLLLSISASGTAAGEPASVWLACLSIRFEKATTRLFGLEYSLELTVEPGAGAPNGELAPLFVDGLPTHGSGFRMEDPTFPEALDGQLAFDIPEPVDANQNGLSDFFEIDQGVESTQTQGFFDTGFDSGLVGARWSREAGSRFGTCTLELESASVGALLEFTHRFEIFQFVGTLTYTAASAGITGQVNLAQAPDFTSTLTGPIQLRRSAASPLAILEIAAGAWTDAGGVRRAYGATEIERDADGQYFGAIQFEDGFLETPLEDYTIWLLSAIDPNDTDSDGIPDLSDEPAGTPSLGVRLEVTKLVITVSGQVGKTYDIQARFSLNSGPWTTQTSVTLGQSVQSVDLPVPSESTVFWRLKEF